MDFSTSKVQKHAKTTNLKLSHRTNAPDFMHASVKFRFRNTSIPLFSRHLNIGHLIKETIGAAYPSHHDHYSEKDPKSIQKPTSILFQRTATNWSSQLGCFCPKWNVFLWTRPSSQQLMMSGVTLLVSISSSRWMACCQLLEISDKTSSCSAGFIILILLVES